MLSSKEALEYIEEELDYFPSSISRNDELKIRKKDKKALNIIKQSLDKLKKYERAFEILKDLFKIRELSEIDKEFFGREYEVYSHASKWLTKEQYELLEELMKSEEDK